MLTQHQIEAKYGIANPTGKGYLTTITLPFKMRLSWSRHENITSFQCHRLIALPLLQVFKDLLAYYGYDKLVELGIDLYGGCFNYRAMRGGTNLSHHSWGIAIDLDPDRNLLKETHKTARFARPEYKPMIDIFYKNGFKGLGPEEDRDWMHFEIAS
jgi:hypothetical protein